MTCRAASVPIMQDQVRSSGAGTAPALSIIRPCTYIAMTTASLRALAEIGSTEISYDNYIIIAHL